MKKTIKNILMAFAILLFVGISYPVYAPPPPPPNPTGNTQDNKLGGGAPIGGGLFILLGLGAVYGSRQLYKIRWESIEE